MSEETLKVGNCTMWAKTIPVNEIYDEIFDPTDFPSEVIAERFKILEIDGSYLVIHECINETTPATQEYKAFCLQEDAFSYLKMLGVERDGEEDD